MKTLKTKIAAARYLLGPKYKKSYSQCGEDLIVERVFKNLGIAKPFYIDIGANDPVIYSNTYLFYKNGAKGIAVEPNPALCEKFKLKRPKDIVLETGMGPKEGIMTYFMFESAALNTFSGKEALGTEKKGHKIVKKVETRISTWKEMLQENDVTKIDFLSLDVEGLDLEILKSIDWSGVRPKIICVETQSFGTAGENSGLWSVEDFLRERGYAVAGMTPINKIFVDEKND